MISLLPSIRHSNFALAIVLFSAVLHLHGDDPAYEPPAFRELLTNGGFEDGAEAWKNRWTIPAPILYTRSCEMEVTDDAFSGTKAMRVTNRNSPESNPVQDLSGLLEPGKWITYKMQLKLDAPAYVDLVIGYCDEASHAKQEGPHEDYVWLFGKNTSTVLEPGIWHEVAGQTRLDFTGQLDWAYPLIIAIVPGTHDPISFTLDDMSLIIHPEELRIPHFHPAETVHSGAVVVALESPDHANIHYTTDGSEPTAESPLYTEPFHLSQSAFVQARAFRSSVSPSPVGSHLYSVRPASETAPAIEITPSQFDLDGFVVEDWQREPLKASLLKVASADEPGRARITFDGTAGIYDCEIHAVPEHDGAPNVILAIDGNAILEERFPVGREFGPPNQTVVLAKPNVQIDNGDVIMVEAHAHESAWGRIAKVVLHPVAVEQAPDRQAAE